MNKKLYFEGNKVEYNTLFVSLCKKNVSKFLTKIEVVWIEKH